MGKGGPVLRLRFRKTGKAKYISHLALMATMTRALRRADIKLYFSEGFNPHPYISVALPLQVGCGSICELMDVGTELDSVPDEFSALINTVLPEGLEIIEAYKPERKFSEITWIELKGALYYDMPVLSNIAGELTGFFASENIVISKRTKSGVSDIDIAPYIRDIIFNGSDPTTLNIKVSAQNPSISAENVISALDGDFRLIKPEYTSFTRINMFDGDLKIFK